MYCKYFTAHFYRAVFAQMERVAQAHAMSTGRQKKNVDAKTLKTHLQWAFEKRNFAGIKDQVGKTLIALFNVSSGAFILKI